ncbi:hypothetical protein ILUMI_25381, partial [Ignelater luminosus]
MKNLEEENTLLKQKVMLRGKKTESLDRKAKRKKKTKMQKILDKSGKIMETIGANIKEKTGIDEWTEAEERETTNLIVCGGPDENAEADEKKAFWRKLQKTVDECTKKIIITGDMNGRVANKTEEWNNEGLDNKTFENEVNVWSRRDTKAQEIVVTRMEEGPMGQVLSCSTAFDMWNKLLAVYEQKSEVSVHLLQQNFFN